MGMTWNPHWGALVPAGDLPGAWPHADRIPPVGASALSEAVAPPAGAHTGSPAAGPLPGEDGNDDATASLSASVPPASLPPSGWPANLVPRLNGRAL
jgi:hypothetical protein